MMAINNERPIKIRSAIEKLNFIDFEWFVGTMINAGVFSCFGKNTTIERPGFNIKKWFVRKGNPDVKITNDPTIKVEISTEGGLVGKVRKDIMKHVGEDVSEFYFITNREASEKQIVMTEEGVKYKFQDFASKKLGNRKEDNHIIDLDTIAGQFDSLNFDLILREYLNIPETGFLNPERYIKENMIELSSEKEEVTINMGVSIEGYLNSKDEIFVIVVDDSMYDEAKKIVISTEKTMHLDEDVKHLFAINTRTGAILENVQEVISDSFENVVTLLDFKVAPNSNGFQDAFWKISNKGKNKLILLVEKEEQELVQKIIGKKFECNKIRILNYEEILNLDVEVDLSRQEKLQIAEKYDQFEKKVQSDIAKKLKMIQAVIWLLRPFHVSDANLVQRVTKYMKIEESEFMRYLNLLEEYGIIVVKSELAYFSDRRQAVYLFDEVLSGTDRLLDLVETIDVLKL